MKKNKRAGMYAVKPRMFALLSAALFSLAVSFSASAESVIRGPYLQQGTDSSMVIKWRTDVDTDSRVEFGTTSANLDQSVVESTLTTEHEVQLTGLSPHTRYFYTIGDSAGPLAGDASYYFRTSPNPGNAESTRIWVIGDSGTANSNARAVRDRYKEFTGSNETHLWLMLGDNAYNSGTDTEYQAAVFDTYPEILQQVPVWPTLGNHDGYSAYSATETGPYYDIFSLPKQAEAGGIASGAEAYYSFEYGNIHFVVLDSYDSDRSVDGGMLTWLENDLAVNQKEWVIAFWHHPPYTKGSHNSDTEGALIDMRENALPILEYYGVDLVLGGHSHSYERSYLIDGEYDTPTVFNLSDAMDSGDGKPTGDGAYSKPGGIGVSYQGAVYAVAGSSGKISGGSLDHPIMYTSLNELGSMILDVQANQLNASFLNSSGVVRDSFTISKGPDTTPPTITSVVATDAVTIRLDYSEPVSLSTAENPLNYTIDGGITVQTAVLDANDSTVLLGVSPLTPEVTYTFTVNNVQDVAGNIIAPSSQQQFSYQLTHTTETRISNGNDDVEEELTGGAVYISSSDIELGDDLAHNGVQTVGLRFQNVNIPQGATIDAAYLEFVVDETGSSATNLEIRAQAADNAPAFAAINQDVTNRPLTAAVTLWDVPAWNTVGEVKQSPEIIDAVQEVVDRAGWTANSAMAFVISGTGTRTAEAYEGVASAAPLLHVEYSMADTGTDNTAPVITAPADILNREATAELTPINLGSPVASDDRDPSPSVSADISGPFPVGATTVTWTATDASGNSASAAQLVTVTDTTAPTITAPADVAVEATGETTAVDLGVPAVSDIADPSPSASVDNTGPFPVGVTTVTWMATDASGNSASTTQLVAVTEAVLQPPAAPTGLTIIYEQRVKGKKVVMIGASLSWTDNSDNESGFVVERCEEVRSKDKYKITTCDYAEHTTTAPDTTSLVIRTDRGYRYRVKAINGAGSSDYSNEVKI